MDSLEDFHSREHPSSLSHSDFDFDLDLDLDQTMDMLDSTGSSSGKNEMKEKNKKEKEGKNFEDTTVWLWLYAICDDSAYDDRLVLRSLPFLFSPMSSYLLLSLLLLSLSCLSVSRSVFSYTALYIHRCDGFLWALAIVWYGIDSNQKYCMIRSSVSLFSSLHFLSILLSPVVHCRPAVDPYLIFISLWVVEAVWSI